MSSNERPIFPGMIPIPELFFSQNTNAPFTTCLECDRQLLANGTEYVIEKAFRRYPGYSVQDTVFEYALCMQCAGGIGEQFSKLSRERIVAYLGESIEAEMERRIDWLIENENVDPAQWLSQCVVKRTPINELSEYQVLGHFKEDSMIISIFPYLIGEEALSEIANLLSNETLDLMDDFSGKHFGLPPEFSDMPRFMPIF